MNTISGILTLLGSLGLFLYGMTLMSEALQKVAGEKLRSFLAAMTSNSFKRIFTGFLITAIIQSSSATTVMVVSFVNAGLLSLTQSIGVIMGANIGTTCTAWLISLLGFKADISVIAIPVIGFGFALMMFKSKKKILLQVKIILQNSQKMTENAKCSLSFLSVNKILFLSLKTVLKSTRHYGKTFLSYITLKYPRSLDYIP